MSGRLSVVSFWRETGVGLPYIIRTILPSLCKGGLWKHPQGPLVQRGLSAKADWGIVPPYRFVNDLALLLQAIPQQQSLRLVPRHLPLHKGGFWKHPQGPLVQRGLSAKADWGIVPLYRFVNDLALLLRRAATICPYEPFLFPCPPCVRESGSRRLTGGLSPAYRFR